MKVPANLAAGQKLRISGRGLRKPDGTYGDLYAVVEVIVPKVLSEKERELYRALKKEHPYEPNVRRN